MLPTPHAWAAMPQPDLARCAGRPGLGCVAAMSPQLSRKRPPALQTSGKWWLRQKGFASPKGIQWPSWLVAFLQVLLASTGLVAVFISEALAVVTSVRRLWDALLADLEEMCYIAAPIGLCSTAKRPLRLCRLGRSTDTIGDHR